MDLSKQTNGFKTMSKRINKPIGGRHELITRKYHARKKDGGMICNKCKKVRKLSEYGSNKSYCLKCKRVKDKIRHKKVSYKLW